MTANGHLLIAQTRLSEIQPHIIIIIIQDNEMKQAFIESRAYPFALLHTGGRNAIFAEIDSILSYNGNFRMDFNGVELVDPGRPYPLEQEVHP